MHNVKRCGNFQFARVSVSDPDPDWIRIDSGPWIRIRIRNPDPDSESGIRIQGQESEEDRYSTKSYDTENTDYRVYEKHCARLQNSTCTGPRSKGKIDLVRIF